MPKEEELTNEKRVAIKYLWESGLSYRKIAEQVGCSHTTAVTIFKSCSVAKKPRSGGPKKFDGRGEMIICRTARRLRFATLKTIKLDVQQGLAGKNPSKQIIRRVLKKYKIKSYQSRKRKPFVSLKNRKVRISWSQDLGDWSVLEWEDVVFSDECRFGLKNDCKTLRVWRTTEEAHNPKN